MVFRVDGGSDFGPVIDAWFREHEPAAESAIRTWRDAMPDPAPAPDPAPTPGPAPTGWQSDTEAEPETPAEPSIQDHIDEVDAAASPGNYSDARHFSATKAQQAAVAEFLGTSNPQWYRADVAAIAQRESISYNEAVDRYNERVALADEPLPRARHVWEYLAPYHDERLEALAANNDPYSPEARFAVQAQTADELTAQIDSWSGPDDHPWLEVLTEARDAAIDGLAGDDEEIAGVILDLVNDGAPAADAVIGAAPVLYEDRTTEELLREFEGRTGDEPRFDPFAYGLQAVIDGRTERPAAPALASSRIPEWGYADPRLVDPDMLDLDFDIAGDAPHVRADFATLDDETRSTYVIAEYFEPTFGGSRVENGDVVLDEIASGMHEETIRGRLSENGLEGEALDWTYEQIEQAATWLTDNPDSRDRMDGADDDDQRIDYTYTDSDAWGHMMSVTAGTDHIVELAIRHDVIDDYATGEHSPREVKDIDAAYVGEVRYLGELDDRDRQILVDEYVDDIARHGLDSDSDLPLFVPLIDGDDASAGALREAYAQKAIELQLLAPADIAVQPIAASFAAESLQSLPPEERADFINGLDGEIRIDEVNSISRAQLFGASLMTSGDVLENPRYDPLNGRHGPQARLDLVAQIIDDLNVAAGPGGTFTQAESDFVLSVFRNAPEASAIAGVTSNDGQRPLAVSDVFADGLAIAAFGGDAGAQTNHGERLREVLGLSRTWELISIDSSNDADTRMQILGTLVYGREGASGTLEFWSSEDFSDPSLERVTADVTADTANRLQIELTGAELSSEQERILREIVATEQGQDLFGFGEHTSHSRRTQFSFMVLENGWTAADFGDGNGWDNALINGEYLVSLAERTLPQPLSEADRARLREIGESEDGRVVIGLDADIDDPGRARYLAAALENDWTSETFGLTDDPILNRTLAFGLARDHVGEFQPGGAKHDALGALDDTDSPDYTDEFVRIALDTPQGGDDVIGAITDAIGERRVEGTAINAVPVSLNAGGVQVDLVLFEVSALDDDGKPKTLYFDMNGKFFDSTDDWHDSSLLPPGTVTFTGTTEGTISESTFVAPSSGEDYALVAATTEEYVDTWWEKHGGKLVNTVVIVGGVLVVVGTAGTATPFVGGAVATFAGTTGTALLGGYGLYQVGSGWAALDDHLDHGGSASWNDPIARGAYLNMAEGTVTALTAGVGGVGFRGGPMAARLGTGKLGAAVNGLNRTEALFQAGANGYQAHAIITSDLDPGEKRKQLAILGIFGAVDVGLPLAVNRVLGRGTAAPVDQGRPGQQTDQAWWGADVEGNLRMDLPPKRISPEVDPNPHVSVDDQRPEMLKAETRLEGAMNELEAAREALARAEAKGDFDGYEQAQDRIDTAESTIDDTVATLKDLSFEQRALDVMLQHGYNIQYMTPELMHHLADRGVLGDNINLRKDPESFVYATVWDAERGVMQGRVLDVHSPHTVESAWQTALDKAEGGQADGVIINLVPERGITLEALFSGRDHNDMLDFLVDRRARNLKELWVVDESGNLHAIVLNQYSPEQIRAERIERDISWDS